MKIKYIYIVVFYILSSPSLLFIKEIVAKLKSCAFLYEITGKNYLDIAQICKMGTIPAATLFKNGQEISMFFLFFGQMQLEHLTLDSGK